MKAHIVRHKTSPSAILLSRNEHLLSEKLLFRLEGQRCVIGHTVKTRSSDVPVFQSTIYTHIVHICNTVYTYIVHIYNTVYTHIVYI